MTEIEKRLRHSEIYAAISLVIFDGLTFTAFTKSKEKFTEIEVERLNVREKNGQLLLVVANSDRLPDPVTYSLPNDAKK